MDNDICIRWIMIFVERIGICRGSVAVDRQGELRIVVREGTNTETPANEDHKGTGSVSEIVIHYLKKT